MAFDVSLVIIANDRQEALLIFFQSKAGQAASGIGSGINSDAVGTNLWGDRRRVAVYNKLAMFRLATQKRLANSQKIIAILAIEGDARPDPGMTEEVIATKL